MGYLRFFYMLCFLSSVLSEKEAKIAKEKELGIYKEKKVTVDFKISQIRESRLSRAEFEGKYLNILRPPFHHIAIIRSSLIHLM